MKLFWYFENLNETANLKISASEDDSVYTIVSTGEVVVGTPDVKWNQIVFINDPKSIWTRGKTYTAVPDSVITKLDELTARLQEIETIEANFKKNLKFVS